MQRKRYQFMMVKEGEEGNLIFRSCLVADVKNLINVLQHHGYKVLGVQEV